VSPPKKPSWPEFIAKEPVALFPLNAKPRPVTMAVVIAALLSGKGCAHTVRPDYYRPEDCLTLRQSARKAGAVRTGSGYVATGLAAGGALAGAVADSRPATIALALGAVLAGAVGLGADSYAKDAAAEWEQGCSLMPVP